MSDVAESAPSDALPEASPEEASASTPESEKVDAERWSLSFARFLGQAARWATPSMPSGRRHDPRPVSALIAELSQMVQSASSDGGAALEKDAAFWRLIEGLHGKRPRIVRAPRSRSGAVGPEAEESLEASDEASGEASAPAATKKGKKKAASEEGSAEQPAKEEAAEPPAEENAE